MGSKLTVLVVVILIVGLIGSIGYLITKKLRTNSAADTPVQNSIATTSGSLNSDMPSAGKVTIAREITIVASEYKFEPSSITIKKGETVKITLKNSGTMPHNWTVEKMMGASIDTIAINQTASITLTASQKGTFTTYCSIGNHRSLGMVGKLIVE